LKRFGKLFPVETWGLNVSKIEKISSIIIAKNEEKNIGRCIESQMNSIDEIIVLVDESSTDKTFQIVSSFEKVIAKKTNWKGFAETKKEALALTSYNWVFWIDADEEITKELSNELRMLKGTDVDFNAYKVARRAFFLDKWIKHSGWYPGYVTRFFNKIHSSFDESKVHEGLIVDGEIGLLENDINHYTDPSIQHYFEKFNRYTSLAAEDLLKKGRIADISDIVVRPFFQFFKMYFVRLGFLDGLRGFILAIFSSAYVFTKYCKLWELNKKS
jgi:glycosyltransferase involved in cell wall biosynthesis